MYNIDTDDEYSTENPVETKGSSGEPTVIGVVSFGAGCGDPTTKYKPVYTNVAHYVDWIKQHVRKCFCVAKYPQHSKSFFVNSKSFF